VTPLQTFYERAKQEQQAVNEMKKDEKEIMVVKPAN
jgi:hypothetical protein